MPTKSKNQNLKMSLQHLVYFKDMKAPLFGGYTLL